jgi:cytochrome c oxidase assembly factor 5
MQASPESGVGLRGGDRDRISVLDHYPIIDDNAGASQIASHESAPSSTVASSRFDRALLSLTRTHAEGGPQQPSLLHFTTTMPSSCKELRAALAACLQQSDCILVQHNKPLDCLSPPLIDTLPEQCQQLKRGFRDCKKGMVDMRKRFRGNQPISSSLELEGGMDGNLFGQGEGGYVLVGGQKVEGVRKPKQLYGGKPAFEAVPEGHRGRGDEKGLGFDEDKTRGL